MANPYAAPQKSNARTGHGLLIVAVCLIVLSVVAPLIGFAVTFLGMASSFEQIADSDAPRASDLANGVSMFVTIGAALVVIGLVAFPSGIVTLVIALLRKRKRAA